MMPNGGTLDAVISPKTVELRPWGDIDLHPKFRALVYQAIEGPAH